MSDAALQRPHHRFTVHEYERMGAAGILGEDDRVELIDGEIVEMPPVGPAHAGIVNRLTELFVLALQGRAVVAVQNPARISLRSEPEPDIVVARHRRDYYQLSHPVPEDVLLIIEVSDSSLTYDREVKAPLYARAGVPELWVLNVAERSVVVHRDPSPDGYRDVTVVGPGETIAPLAFPDLAIAVEDIFGDA